MEFGISKHLHKIIFILTASIFILSACTHKNIEEFKTASIEGKAYSIRHPYAIHVPEIKDTINAANKAIYLIYGEDTIPQQQCTTDSNGLYKFDSLLPGVYTILTYTQQVRTTENKIVKQQVVLQDNQRLIAEDFYLDTIARINYSGLILGRVYTILFDDNGKILDTITEHGIDVYIKKQNEDNYFDKTTTDNGRYQLYHGIAHDIYEIYAYSQDIETLDTVIASIEVNTQSPNNIFYDRDLNIYKKK